MLKIKTVVISVSDKSGIVEFARFLRRYKVEVISTGGTAKTLQENGIRITPISRITGNAKEDYFDGRMKTISFNYESALLYKRNNPQHIKQAKELGIPQIDMVVCNLYPFEKVVQSISQLASQLASQSAGQSVSQPVGRQLKRQTGKTADRQAGRPADNQPENEAIENVDIGGPCMIRAAAKNYEWLAVVVDPSQYNDVMKELDKNNGCISLDFRRELMVQAFSRTADYDSAIHTYFNNLWGRHKVKRLSYQNGLQLGRYAENWHQKGWIYKSNQQFLPSIPWAKQVYGGPLGYNNYLDAEAALQSVLELKDRVAVSIIKHTNPCGYATGKNLKTAFERAWQGDPTSAFGSVIALTRPLDMDVAEILGQRFVELVVVPSINKDAFLYLKALGKEKANLRLLEVGELTRSDSTLLRYINGGLLEQEADNKFYLTATMKELFAKPFIAKCENSGKELTVGIITRKKPPLSRSGLYEFALRYIKHLKSNAIGIVREYSPGYYQVLGMGCGQPNRKDSVLLAGQKAIENLKLEYEQEKKEGKAKGAVEKHIARELASDRVVLVSDAFFPFRDGIDNIAKSGVKYVIQPGGSVRDDEIIKAADEQGIAMLFTGVRKFYH